MSTNTIVVAGDIVVDHHLYEGDRLDHRDETLNGVHLVREHGGAVLIQNLIGAVLRAEATATPVLLGLDLGKSDIPASCSAYALWSPCPKSGHDAKGDHVWRVTKALGYGPKDADCQSHPNPASASCFPTAAEVPSAPAVLVLDDSGACFRAAAWRHVWCLPTGPALPWIILKLSGSIGTGDLWHALQLLPGVQKRLAILISANQLRQSAVRLSRGLSWERTAEHLLAELFDRGGNPELEPLKQARHLIVNFEHDGAIWIDLHARSATLLYDPMNAEGEWAAEIKGEAFAYQTCLAAALACEFARHPAEADIPDALDRGLAAMRRLRLGGHGPTQNAQGGFQPGAGFPCASLAEEILSPTCRFARRTALPGKLVLGTPLPHPWSILATAQDPANPPHPLHGLARQIVIRGEIAIAAFPQLRIGQLLTVSRDEMESMRALRRLFVAYKDHRNPGKKPLSIGVFGAPGAGKSFGVKQLAIAMFAGPGAKDYDGWIEFNLSQFDKPTDLIGAFHQVRDRVLQGFVPVVFWDEFDSQAYKWLQYLLAPMQDGKFQEEQITHSLGKCVFIFAGGTSRTFDGFGPLEGDREAEQKFRLAKGPDFKSRLDGYLDVLGPNQRQLSAVVPDPRDPNAPPMLQWTDDPEDIFYPVRRALLIRSLLGMKPAERPDIDLGLLTALLRVPLYKHGARSLEKVLDPFKTPKGARPQPLRRSRLPAPPQLRLHVDDGSFHDLVRSHRDRIPADWTQQLAPAIHEAWRLSLKQTGEKNANDVPFDQLPEDSKASNRAAAARIPSVLALAGLELAAGPATPDEEQAVIAHIEHHLDLLADGEHEGWMADRIANGWRFAKNRDNSKKLHNCLLPFLQISAADQSKDCNQVRQYPGFARLAGLKIGFVTD